MKDEIGRFRSIVIAAGGVATVFGLYWDDAWHTDVGRDTFFSRPHLLLYAGVSVLFVVLASWAWARYRALGWAGMRDAAVLLPLLGAAVTLGAAPLDEAWHQLFGRDAVTWSPPHMVAVAGMAAFAAGLYLLATRRTARTSPLVGAVIGAFLIAALVTVVMEFETDVPQFPVGLYLPVQLAALTFAFGLIRRLAVRPWAVTQAAAVYVLLRLAVVGFLSMLGHSLPTVMPTVIAAFAFEFALRSGGGRWKVAVVTTAATVASHVAAHALQPAGLAFTGIEVAVALAAGVVVSWGVLTAVGIGAGGRVRPVPAARVAMSALLLILLVAAPSGPAFAHDPGQGADVAPVLLEAVRQGDRIDVRLAAPAGCAGWVPVRLLARRAGRTISGPLASAGDCRFGGQVTVDDPGRWFVYAEVGVHGRATEAWLPVEDGTHRKVTMLYVAPGDGPHGVQIVAGVLLYVVVLAIFAAIVVVYRRAARGSAGGRRVGAAEGVAVGAG